MWTQTHTHALLLQDIKNVDWGKGKIGTSRKGEKDSSPPCEMLLTTEMSINRCGNERQYFKLNCPFKNNRKFVFVPPHSTWPARLEKQIGIGCLRRDCCNKYWTVGHDRQSCYKKRSPHQKVYLHLLPLTRNMLHNEHDDPLPYGTVLSLFSLTVWRDNDQTQIESLDQDERGGPYSFAKFLSFSASSLITLTHLIRSSDYKPIKIDLFFTFSLELCANSANKNIIIQKWRFKKKNTK